MFENDGDGYVVRVMGLLNGSFTWELCRCGGRLVLQRSPKSFPTRVEALFDSAQSAIALVQGEARHSRKREPV